MSVSAQLGASEMAQWGKVLAAKPDGLSLILGLTQEKMRTKPCNSPCDLHTCAVAHAHMLTRPTPNILNTF